MSAICSFCDSLICHTGGFRRIQQITQIKTHSLLKIYYTIWWHKEAKRCLNSLLNYTCVSSVCQHPELQFTFSSCSFWQCRWGQWFCYLPAAHTPRLQEGSTQPAESQLCFFHRRPTTWTFAALMQITSKASKDEVCILCIVWSRNRHTESTQLEDNQPDRTSWCVMH